MKNYKGVLLDFNGTLFFDSKMHIDAFKEYYQELGKECPSEEYIVKNIFGKSNPLIYAENFANDENVTDCETFSKKKEEKYRRICLESPELMHYAKGAAEMLDYLKENSIPYALATGSEIDNLNFYIEHLNLGKWFDESNTVYGDGTFPGKPAPDIYILAAKKLGLDASDCVVFEDGTSGIISAQEAGAAVVCVYEDILPSPIIDGLSPDMIYHDFTNWKEILKHFGILR